MQPPVALLLADFAESWLVLAVSVAVVVGLSHRAEASVPVASLAESWLPAAVAVVAASSHRAEASVPVASLAGPLFPAALSAPLVARTCPFLLFPGVSSPEQSSQEARTQPILQ